jgi:threonine dehydratase
MQDHAGETGATGVAFEDEGLTRAAIVAAAQRIEAQIRRTPVMDLAPADPLLVQIEGLTRPLNLKLELVQHAGSFKARGAFNTLLSLPVPEAGVAAASGGNHGIAVALAARRLGYTATIFVPEISSPAKMAAIRAQGATLVVGGARYDDAQAACDAHVAKTGALKVHPFAAAPTIAGQGTLAREWEEQVADLDTVLIAVGGGGLIAGIGAWWAGTGAPRKVKVVGVEPTGSRALHAALEVGGPVDVGVDSVAADSLGARNVGPLVHAVAARSVAEVVLVGDDAIVAAQRALWSHTRIATEPGGATALAALLSGAYQPQPDERIGVLICGGNVDPAKLADGA